MTIGAALGRLFGHLLADAGHVERANVGRLALMGAGAVLCGVTRMTLTLAAILVEVTQLIPCPSNNSVFILDLSALNSQVLHLVLHLPVPRT